MGDEAAAFARSPTHETPCNSSAGTARVRVLDRNLKSTVAGMGFHGSSPMETGGLDAPFL